MVSAVRLSTLTYSQAMADSTTSAPTTRERILARSRELFSTHSFAAVSLSQIAREAEVSTTLIIKLFQSKERLFEETVDFSASAEALFAGPFERLGATSVAETLTAPFEAPYSMIRTLSVSGGTQDSLSAIGARIKTDILTVLTERITAEAPHPHPTPALRAQSAVALLTGLSLMRRVGDTEFYSIDQGELRRHYAQLVQHVIDGSPAPAAE